ncbi:MAG: TetR/AcrR family transcriptional regulator [Planctomycetota bacterium]|nr:TetR/AcrR family transcriptional regulator [Planctomycetota bacterium]
MPSTKRDQLIETARKLFARDGFHNTGIDTILAEAGVAKMTLYKHFKSKEELILAALRRQDEEFRNTLMQGVEKQTDDPRGRLLALFDQLRDVVSHDDFCGCLFINAAAEYSTKGDPIHQAAIEHKRLIHQYITKLAGDAGARAPEELARQVALLMEGAVVSAQVTGECMAKSAQQAAEALLDRDLRSPK